MTHKKSVRAAKAITIRLLAPELAHMDDDIALIAEHGGPRSSVTAYCKHGAMNYARLRRMEAKARLYLTDRKLTDEERAIAKAILEAAS